MDITNYSLTNASLEIIGLSLLAFILGVVTCYVLKKLGICCRSKQTEEPSLFTLKEPAAFDLNQSNDFAGLAPTSTNTFAFNNAALGSAIANTPTLSSASIDSSSDLREPNPSEYRSELATPTIEVALPTPMTAVAPELPPMPAVPVMQPSNTHSIEDLTQAGSGYVVDINTLLRRNPETTPVATLAAASKHQSSEQNGRVASTVSIAELLNTETDLIDNLRKLEGITPRIEAILNESGIKNYQTLSKTDNIRLKQILETAGEPFKNLDPQSWPFQAELAAKGEWARLQDYQSYLQSNKT
jgi:predicted flap endonuclease-1-like 5' DNA nuclease